MIRKDGMATGKKGFIFTLDVTLAILLVIIVVVTANHYTRFDQGSTEDLQVTKLGSDIMAVLDNTELLDTLSTLMIEAKLKEITPPNYGIRLKITTSLSGSYVMGDELPEDRGIGSGRRVFVLTEGELIKDYGVVQYYMWLR